VGQTEASGEPLDGSPTRQVTVDSVGAELLVSDSGGQGIPIVFLSGGPGMADYLSDVANLVEGRRVVTYDQRGTGGSRVCDGDYSTEAQVADLESVRKSLEAERLHIFGHSWGGMLAQLYATTHIDSVASLFLFSPTPGVGSEWVAMEKTVMQFNKSRSSGLGFAMMGMRSLLARIPRFGRRSLEKMYAQVWLNYQKPGQARSATAAFLEGIGQRATFATRAAAIRLPADHLDGVLPEAVFPFAIVFGQDDIYGEHTRVVTERYPNARVEFWEDCGHLAWIDAPDRFTRQLNEFYAPLP
jgi:proline iminopeptidase